MENNLYNAIHHNDIINVMVFIVRFLNEAAHQGITSVDKKKLIHYISGIVTDKRYTKLTCYTNDDNHRIVISALKELNNSCCYRTVPLPDNTYSLILDNNWLDEFEKPWPALSDEESNQLKKIVNEWKLYSEPGKIIVANRIRQFIEENKIIVYRMFPNNLYAICTNDSKRFTSRIADGIRSKMNIPAEDSVRWDLVTDGIPKFGRTMSESTSNIHTYSSVHPIEGNNFESRTSRHVTVSGSDYVAIQGYVNDELKSAFLYTLLSGDEFERTLEIAGKQNPGECLTNDSPNVRVLKLHR